MKTVDPDECRHLQYEYAIMDFYDRQTGEYEPMEFCYERRFLIPDFIIPCFILQIVCSSNIAFFANIYYTKKYKNAFKKTNLGKASLFIEKCYKKLFKKNSEAAEDQQQ